MKSVKRNFIYNIVYQILILIIPIITMPYISRVMGSAGIGTYSYTYSIVYYFMILSMLGINNYGNRTIAKVRDNKEKLTRSFKEIHLFQIVTSVFMTIIYFLFVFITDSKYKDICLFQSLYIISCIFDINWFFFGLEEFRMTVIRNTVIKIFTLVLIFLFVKNNSDVWKYTLILSGSTLLSQLSLWPFVNKYILKMRIELKDIKKHIKPCIKLFLPVIAVTIYKVMDKTMIGFFSDVSEVGFYENAEKIISVPNSIITALGTVMLPRMSNLYQKGESKAIKNIIDLSIRFMMFLAFPMMFGLIAISKNFTILFFGSEFLKTSKIIVYLSVTLIFLSWGNVIRTQYLIPKERDKEYIISAFLGAIVNLILNLIFIPKYCSIGACFGTVIAELIVMIYQTFTVRNDLPIKRYILEISRFFINSIFMFLIVKTLDNLELNTILKMFSQIIIGAVVYIALNIKFVGSIVAKRKSI